jgi:hypothetical protein
MRRFYERDTEWETFSASAALAQDETKTDEANSPAAVLGEIALVIAGALGAAAAIDIALTFLHVMPFV